MIEVFPDYINTYIHVNRYTKYISSTNLPPKIEFSSLGTYVHLNIQYTIQVLILRQEWRSQLWYIRTDHYTVHNTSIYRTPRMEFSILVLIIHLINNYLILTYKEKNRLLSYQYSQ